MKKVILGIVLALIMIFNTGCEKSPSKLISLTFKEGTNHSGVFIFKNESDYEAKYDDGFQIMKKEDGRWTKLEMINDLLSNLINTPLKPGTSNELSVDWEYVYGRLPKGSYKLIKRIKVNNLNYDISGIFNVE